ncbi:SDR family NAD(P)-dependent oxidoreductase [Butyrivibrio sp. FCS006]|uniref:SDR family NAD(P)-dependent oxidoreductase n=1 Tax=Butyrivibrio sp. FCS006 TaxID=1280684 RepID=UPI00041D6747|nr:SDR family oxidoreductase [Butyrivibrio sp. FCS006]
MDGLEGKSYLIIGGTSGIGLHVAKSISTYKGNVVIVGSNEKKLNKSLQQLPSNCWGVLCDLRNPMNVREIFEVCKKNEMVFDGIVYSAGVSPMMSVVENDCGIMIDTFSVNCLSFVETVKCMEVYECVTNKASIVAISSIAASQSVNRQALYAGSKAALEEIVRCIAKELLLKGVRVNALALGAVRTELFEELESNNAELAKRYPLGAIPFEQISHMIMYLLSDLSDHITGTVLKMDSGHDVWLR